LLADTSIKRSIAVAMDIKPIASFTKNGGSRQWKLTKRVVVALTHVSLYYGSYAVLNWIVFKDPLLLNVRVIYISNSMEMILSLLVDDLKYLNQSVGKNIVLEERFVRPFAKDIDKICSPISL